jgi:hypothetical protein
VFKESSQQLMEFPHDNPILLGCVLEFIYTDNVRYNVAAEEGHSSHSGTPAASNHSDSDHGDICNSPQAVNTETELKFYCDLYGMADKFLLPVLKDVALREFCGCFGEYCDGLFHPCKHESDHSAVFTLRLVKTVYSNTPDHDRDLRDLIVTLVLHDLNAMTHSREDASAYRKVMFAVPEFCYDLATIKIRPELLNCTGCERMVSAIHPLCSCGGEEHTFECLFQDSTRRLCQRCGRKGVLEHL